MEDTSCTIRDVIKRPFGIPTSLGSRFASSLKRSRIPMNLLLLHKQALFVFTTSLRVTRGARNLHVLAREVACKVGPCGCLLLMCREFLWCEMLGSVWKGSRFALDCFKSWGGHVRTRRCGFAIPLINVGGDRVTTVFMILLLTRTAGGLSEKKIGIRSYFLDRV